MKVLVTGSNGMVARASIRYCMANGDEVIALTRDQLDISRRDEVFENVSFFKPEVILNCAAYTDVDGAETDEKGAYAANASGPENLALAAKEFGANFVTISTDYVFDGKKEGFYTEDDRPDPQSVYARSKYEGELRSSAVNPDSIIVRSGWIYGHAGTNFLSILPELVSERRTFKAIDDVFGTPTFADDLAVRLRELAAAKASGIFHATNYGDGTSYYGFACTVEKILGTEVQMTERVSEKDLDRPAARPRNSRLKSIRSEKYDLGPLRDWKEALNAFLKEKGGFKPPNP